MLYPFLGVAVMNPKKESDKIAKQLSSVRQKKIAKLKAQITTGRYHITNAALAKALFLAQ